MIYHSTESHFDLWLIFAWVASFTINLFGTPCNSLCQWCASSSKAGTQERACSCNTLPEQSSLVCTIDFLRKNMLRNITFAPKFCSLISNWFDMREQAPWCVLKFACRDMTCLRLANQIALIGPNRVLLVYWLGYFAGAYLRSKLPRVNRPQRPTVI